jgi:hypothetical protein
MPMILIGYHFHQDTECLKITLFRIKFELVFLKERNNNLHKIIAIVDLVPIAMLMVGAGVFLKIDTSTTKKLLERVQNIFVSLDEFNVKFWFYSNPPFSCCDKIDISYVDREASFTIY